MKLTTSRNREYIVDWIDGPTITSGHVMMQMHDERKPAVIAEEFDGLEWLKRESEEQGDKLFEGYSNLVSITRKNADVVLLSLAKP